MITQVRPSPRLPIAIGLWIHLALAACAAFGFSVVAARAGTFQEQAGREQLMAVAERLLAAGGEPAEQVVVGGQQVVVAVGRADRVSSSDPVAINLQRSSALFQARSSAARALAAHSESPSGGAATEAGSAQPKPRLLATTVLRLVEDPTSGGVSMAIACWPGGAAAQASAGCARVFDDLDAAKRSLIEGLRNGLIIPLAGDAVRLADGKILVLGYGMDWMPDEPDRGGMHDRRRRMLEAKARLGAVTSLAEYLGGVDVNSDRQTMGPQQLPGAVLLAEGVIDGGGLTRCWHVAAIDLEDYENSVRLRDSSLQKRRQPAGEQGSESGPTTSPPSSSPTPAPPRLPVGDPSPTTPAPDPVAPSPEPSVEPAPSPSAPPPA